jgi:penicillin-binding protein 2
MFTGINRFKITVFLFVTIWFVMFIRLYYLSIKSNVYYEELAKSNAQKSYYIKPARGEIFDNKGRLLAVNDVGFSISIVPKLDTKSKEFKDLLKDLKRDIPDINVTRIEKVYKNESSSYNHKYIRVIEFIPFGKMLNLYPRLSLNEFINIEVETKRIYPFAQYGAHVIGYIGKSNDKENKKDETVKIIGKVGKGGVEKYYNNFLQGEPGAIISKVTATNEEVNIIKKIPPKENRNLTLNLDIELQKMIYDKFGSQAGAAIVMRPNGEIIAAVSTPSYNPNLFVGGISKEEWEVLQNNFDHPFTNKFLNGVYPPGSTIKMGMALAIGEANIGTLDKLESCPGAIKVGKGGQVFRDWSKNGHGIVDLRKAIRESVDVYFYKKSLATGIDRFAPNLKKFGFGIPTGIDILGESSGVVPDSNWKRSRFKEMWYPGDTVNTSIGQGYMLVTPMQLARYTATIATSYLPQPMFVSKVGSKKLQPKLQFVNLDQKHLNQIRLGMFDVCNTPGGTALSSFGRNVPIHVAGKTGTSQVTGISRNEKVRMKESQMEYYHRSHAWITTYAPFEKPEFIVTVLVEHGGHGGTASGPIAAEIYRWLYRNGYFKGVAKQNIVVNTTSSVAPVVNQGVGD